MHSPPQLQLHSDVMSKQAAFGLQAQTSRHSFPLNYSRAAALTARYPPGPAHIYLPSQHRVGLGLGLGSITAVSVVVYDLELFFLPIALVVQMSHPILIIGEHVHAKYAMNVYTYASVYT